MNFNKFFYLLIVLLSFGCNVKYTDYSHAGEEQIIKTIIQYQKENYYWYGKNFFNIPFDKNIILYTGSIALVPDGKKNKKYKLPESIVRQASQKRSYSVSLVYFKNNNFIINNFYIYEDETDNHYKIYTFFNGEKEISIAKMVLPISVFNDWEKIQKEEYDFFKKNIIISKEYKPENPENINEIIGGIKKIVKNDIYNNNLRKNYGKFLNLKIQYFNFNENSSLNAYKKSISVFYQYNGKVANRLINIYKKDSTMGKRLNNIKRNYKKLYSDYTIFKDHIYIFADKEYKNSRIYSGHRVENLYKENRVFYRKFKEHIIDIKVYLK